MSATLTSSLEQIGACTQSISELPFQGRGRFTNAILASRDITALLRDTQAHERALFRLAPQSLGLNVSASASTAGNLVASGRDRRSTFYDARLPKGKAVAAVLGGDLYEKIQQQPDARSKGEVDVELLLQGAEKLANVYPIAGAADRIARLRRKHQQLQANIEHYEGRVVEQRRQLDKLNVTTAETYGADLDDIDIEEPQSKPGASQRTDAGENWQMIQNDINELEEKKRSLEQRVQGMEKDLGGLMR